MARCSTARGCSTAKGCGAGKGVQHGKGCVKGAACLLGEVERDHVREEQGCALQHARAHRAHRGIDVRWRLAARQHRSGKRSEEVRVDVAQSALQCGQAADLGEGLVGAQGQVSATGKVRGESWLVGWDEVRRGEAR